MSRTRPVGMGGMPPINPIDIAAMVGIMGWPCERSEAVHVLAAMDEAFRALHANGEK